MFVAVAPIISALRAGPEQPRHSTRYGRKRDGCRRARLRSWSNVMSQNCRTKPHVFQYLCFLLFGLMLLLCGCALRTTRKTASVNRAKNVEISATELSSRNQSLLALYSSE